MSDLPPELQASVSPDPDPTDAGLPDFHKIQKTDLVFLSPSSFQALDRVTGPSSAVAPVDEDTELRLNS